MDKTFLNNQNQIPVNGLSTNEALSRLKDTGYNELTAKKKTSFLIRFFNQFKDFLVIILLIAAIISVFANPHEWIESLIIIIVVFINSLIGTIQEIKAETSLETLEKLTHQESKVLRDGKITTIETRMIVPGDIICLEAGDLISADALIIEATSLQVNESSLTGESVPVSKEKDEYLYSSTLVTNGNAKAIVTSTGMKTKIGNIANLIDTTKATTTPLQLKLNQIAKVIGIICIIVCIIVFFLEILLANKPFLLAFPDAFLSAIALTVAAIPEGLTAIVTVVLALGVERMAKNKAIIKKLPAVETLGCTNVICSDKTGTLTINKMTVQSLYYDKLKLLQDSDNSNVSLSTNEQDLLTYFSICTTASIDSKNSTLLEIGDPTEIALLKAKDKYCHNKNINYQNITIIPFDSVRKMMTVIVELNKNDYLVITKGAIDSLINISSNYQKKVSLLLSNQKMTKQGLRVLALGIKRINKLPKNINSKSIEKDLTILGLIGLNDPIRYEVKKVINDAKLAGIRTVLITGDHLLTATAVAKELGIINSLDEAIESQELNHFTDQKLQQNIIKYGVFARVTPEDKMRIIKAWQDNDNVVAMTGDGVNDAPALKKADIGCAMGITGTDVAKEAADLILVDDNFTTIVTAIKEGRTIYDNIKKIVQYLISSNIGEVLTILLATIIAFIFQKENFGVPLLAIHLLWINLITDSLPAFALGLEKGEKDNMTRAPRSKKEKFFTKSLTKTIIKQGILIATLTLFSYYIGFSDNANQILAQTMAFVTLSSSQLFHSFNIKSRASIFHWSTFNNPFLLIASIIGFMLQILLLYIPTLANIFHVYPLPTNYLIIAIGLGLMTIIFSEIEKYIKNQKNNQ